MEDVVEVTVPSRFFASPIANSQAVGYSSPNFFGPRISGPGALHSNICQFLLGAPIVEYHATQFFITSQSHAVINFLDTSIRAADLTKSPVSNSSPYSAYTAQLFQNKSDTQRSSAVGVYVIIFNASSFNILQGTTPLTLTPSGGGSAASYDTPTDFYLNGKFQFCICINMISGQFPATGQTDVCLFRVKQPTYTESLNWAELTSPSRNNATLHNACFSVLYHDTGRKENTSSSQPLSDYDMQGLGFAHWNQDSLAIPVATIDHRISNALGSFWNTDLFNTSTNNIFTQFSAGYASSATNNTANFVPNHFRMIRGNGYIRILARVAAPLTGVVDSARSIQDEVYFFGKFDSFETVEDYPHPMAFFGAVGKLDPGVGLTVDGSRSWWRASAGRLDQPDCDIWGPAPYRAVMQTNGQYSAIMPFILSHEFQIEATATGTWNQPRYVKMPLSSNGVMPIIQTVNPTGNTSAISIGSKNDATRCFATRFETGRESVGWDPIVGYNSPAMGMGLWLANPGGIPNLEPFTLTQLSGDHHTWTFQDGTSAGGTEYNQPTSFFADTDIYENIGVMPGLYWGPEIEFTANTGKTYYESGSEFTIGGKRYYMVIGARSTWPTEVFQIRGDSLYNSGNLFFAMDPME